MSVLFIGGVWIFGCCAWYFCVEELFYFSSIFCFCDVWLGANVVLVV